MLELCRIGENAKHDRDFNINRPNGHPVYLLLFVRTPARFCVQGIWQETAPDVAFLFKPGQTHRYCAAGDLYINSWAHIRSPRPLLDDYFPFGRPIQLYHASEYFDLFHVICNEFYGTKPHRGLVLHNLLTALMEKLSDESNSMEYPPIYYELSSLRRQIYSCPEKDWNITGMAKELNISNGYLQNQYKHFFHTTCISDVVQSRVQAATELLLSTEKSIEEIAGLCGYHYVEHFIRQYKAQTGSTPGQTRKRG